jgi:hypothetical protein
MRILRSLRWISLSSLIGFAPLAASAAPIIALEIDLVFSTEGIVVDGPEGLAFGPGAGPGGQDVLFVSQGDGCSNCTIHVFEPDGTHLPASDFSTGFGDVRGVDYLSSGNLLIASSSFPKRVVEITTSGAVVSGGIDITLDFLIEPEAAFFHEGRGTVFVVDEEGLNEAGTIIEFSTAGTQLAIFPYLGGNFDDPSGADFNVAEVIVGGTVIPAGSLFVVDDNSGGLASKLTIYTPDGTLLFESEEFRFLTATHPDCQGRPKPPACNDSEGLAWDEANDRFFIAFEDQERVVAFRAIPEPSIWLLLALGLAGAASLRRNRAS